MTQLDYVSACVLGLVQGLTEFLPISSSAHLVIVQKLLDIKGDAPETLLFDVLSHIGTLAAVFVVFAETFRRYVRQLFVELSRPCCRRPAWLISFYGVAASMPTAAIGFGFKDQFERDFDSLAITGAGLLISGGLLFWISRIPRPRMGWRRFGWWRAAAVGVAQGIAISPGVSRSGSTICVALLLGLKRRWAADFSFFIMVPAILGAAAFKMRDTMRLPADQLAAIAWSPIIAGTLVSFVAGYYSLRLLLRLVICDKLHAFCYYCWALGGALMIWSLYA